MENPIVIDQFLAQLDCSAEIASSPPGYVAFPLRGAGWEILHCTSGQLSRQARKLIGAHLQLVEAKLDDDLTIPFTVTKPSCFLYIQLRGTSRFYDQGLLLLCPERPYLSLCYYPAGNYTLQLGEGLHSFALISLAEDWFKELGSSYPAFSQLTEAFLYGATDCHRLAHMPLNNTLSELLDEICFTTVKSLQNRTRMVQQLGKVLELYHGFVATVRAAAGRSTTALRAALDSYLEQYYMDERRCSIQQIKKSLGLTRHSSEKIAKESLGCTLRRYVLEFRIGKACALLLETNAKISDIAYQTGFSDLAHFTNSFKRSMGMQPSAYRKKKS